MARCGARLSFAAALMLSATGAPPASAQDRQMSGVGITLFEDREFRGQSATFREDVPDLRKFNLNDRITSFRIARGESWEVCIDIEYGGRCQVFSGSEPDLHDRSGWNDEISSLRRIRGRGRGGVRPPVGQPQIVLYDRTGFRGSSRSLTGPMSSLGSFGSRVQSVRIMGGRWELCEGTRWSDRCLTVNESVSDIGRAGLRGVSSVRPRSRVN
jgi:Beta/Gamma crystallin